MELLAKRWYINEKLFYFFRLVHRIAFHLLTIKLKENAKEQAAI